MNDLAILKQTAQTMSSREIAQLCDKRHDHVLRDINNLNLTYQQMGLPKVGEGYYTHPSTGSQQHREFLLTKEQSIDLVTGYRADIRIRINRRWQELETQNNAPALPNFADPVQAARAWADAMELQQQAIAQVAELQPKAQALEAISHSTGSLGIREAAKAVGMGQNEFVAWCTDKNKPVTSRFMYRDDAGVLHAYSHRIDAGMMTEKLNTFVGGDGRDRSAPRVKFTPKGITHIAKMLKSKFEVVA
ncbi:phage regulatory protein/antirepressor Ant [Moraxella osloensis]|uniref:phage antirepressor KilAC domain-containing protein n=1 Tax=Faucicola osloensis TaxID=34062 RepID=UPI0020058EC6|nr:phage regulatory protein/antirepressor Ant [Moraxella osloensis]MCK6157221.1 phage regulatory protein/antirepressor Ant [Moraxella osloensis]